MNFFKPGWRTIKTALSVFCCLIIYHIFNLNPAIACLSTVFSLREDTSKTLSFGTSRLISNAFGGFLALILFKINLLVNNNWIILCLLPLFVIIFIQTMNIWHNQAGIISGMAAFFMIFFTIPSQKSFEYAILRTIDTFVGVIIAIIINHLINPQKATPKTTNQKIIEIDQQISKLQKEKQKLKDQNNI